ncbi:MAG TPA: sugar transferase [Bryobacteraceae bacterium]|nr:sugar transferase [Bryobacteraceae bacterium]
MCRRIGRTDPFLWPEAFRETGLTGWAQVHTSAAEMPDSIATLEYDLYYIKHLSPTLDLYTLLLALRRLIAES